MLDDTNQWIKLHTCPEKNKWLISASSGYEDDVSSAWRQDKFTNKQALLGCEMWKIRCKTKPKTITCRNLNTFVFLFAPPHLNWIDGCCSLCLVFLEFFFCSKADCPFFSPGYCSVFTLKSKAHLWQLLLWFGLIYWWTWIECYVVFGTSACGFSVHLQAL